MSKSFKMKKIFVIAIFGLIVSQIQAQTNNLNFIKSQNNSIIQIKKRTASYTFHSVPSFRPYKPEKDSIPNKNGDPVETSSPNDDDKIFIDFVGTGDLQKSVSSGQEPECKCGKGIIFEQYKGQNHGFQSLEVDLTINVASTADSLVAKVDPNGNVTNIRNFGSFIMNPVSAKQAIYSNVILYFGYPKNTFGDIAKYVSGVNFKFIGSNNVWQINNTNDPNKVINTNLGAFLFSGGIFHEFIPNKYRLDDKYRSKYSLYLGFGFTSRGIVGDFITTNDSSLRKQFLGTTLTQFNGVEFNAGFRLNNIRINFEVPIMYTHGNIDVPGLTGKQFLFSIRFIGGFGLEIKPKDNSTEEKTADTGSKT